MVIASKTRTDSIVVDRIDVKLSRVFSESGNSLDTGAVEQIGITVRHALDAARHEARAIVGLSESINALSKAPEDFLFCFLAASDTDSNAPANHIHQVLLEAFCFEHDIYIIKVDSATKMSHMLGIQRVESCALVQKNWYGERCREIVTDAEGRLVDYCELHWDNPIKPVVKLPEK